MIASASLAQQTHQAQLDVGDSTQTVYPEYVTYSVLDNGLLVHRLLFLLLTRITDKRKGPDVSGPFRLPPLLKAT